MAKSKAKSKQKPKVTFTEPTVELSASNPFTIELLQLYKSRVEGSGNYELAKKVDEAITKFSKWQRENPDHMDNA